MEGVVILETFQHYSIAAGWTNWCFLPLLFIIFCAALIIIGAKYGWPEFIIYGCGAIPLAIAGSIFFGLFMNGRQVLEYETYKVAIEDFVDMEEFEKRYEIIDERGNNYIVKERVG